MQRYALLHNPHRGYRTNVHILRIFCLRPRALACSWRKIGLENQKCSQAALHTRSSMFRRRRDMLVPSFFVLLLIRPLSYSSKQARLVTWLWLKGDQVIAFPPDRMQGLFVVPVHVEIEVLSKLVAGRI